MNKTHEKLAEAIEEYNSYLKWTSERLPLASASGLISARKAMLQWILDATPDADPTPHPDTGESLEERILMLEYKVGCLELENASNNTAFNLVSERIAELEKGFEHISNEPKKPTEEDLKNLFWLCRWKLIVDVRRESLTRIYDYLNATL